MTLAGAVQLIFWRESPAGFIDIEADLIHGNRLKSGKFSAELAVGHDPEIERGGICKTRIRGDY
jgi:hypothetical protein